MKTTFLLIVGFLWSGSGIKLQEKSIIKPAENLLCLNTDTRNYYRINDNGIYIYSGSENKKAGKHEFFVAQEKITPTGLWMTLSPMDSVRKYYKQEKFPLSPVPKNNPTQKPVKKGKLSGIRIALDPGHIAGDRATADLERKIVPIEENKEKGILNATVIEGVLTLATANHLKELLEKEGAEVLMTRDKPNVASFGMSFGDWKAKKFKSHIDSLLKRGEISKKKYDFYRLRAREEIIFRDLFLQEDLKERAKLINAFKPDIALIIHYNADEKNTDWIKPTKKNFCMAFVPGGFSGNLLQKQEYRIHFLRLLCSPALSLSVKYAGIICREFEKTLDVPLARSSDAEYLQETSVFTGEPGVFARNLALTRLLTCPLVYGETLYQDNEKEYLNLDHTRFGQGQTPQRVMDVVNAYYSGVLKIFSK